MIFDVKKWKRAFYDSVLLTIITFLLSSPYLYHFIVHRPDKLSPFNARVSSLPEGSIGAFILSQLLMFLLLIFICSFLGFGYWQKYGFKGLGSLNDLRQDLLYFVPAALAVNLAMYFGFDRHMMMHIPSLYPSSALWGFAKALMHSTTFEIVSKFGLVTVAMGIFRNKHVAVIIPAAFFAFLVPNTFFDYNVEFGWNFISVAAVSTTFIYGVISGYIFVHRGLVSTMTLRFLLDLKYIVYALLLQS